MSLGLAERLFAAAKMVIAANHRMAHACIPGMVVRLSLAFRG